MLKMETGSAAMQTTAPGAETEPDSLEANGDENEDAGGLQEQVLRSSPTGTHLMRQAIELFLIGRDVPPHDVSSPDALKKDTRRVQEARNTLYEASGKRGRSFGQDSLYRGQLIWP